MLRNLIIFCSIRIIIHCFFIEFIMHTIITVCSLVSKILGNKILELTGLVRKRRSCQNVWCCCNCIRHCTVKYRSFLPRLRCRGNLLTHVTLNNLLLRVMNGASSVAGMKRIVYSNGNEYEPQSITNTRESLECLPVHKTNFHTNTSVTRISCYNCIF